MHDSESTRYENNNDSILHPWLRKIRVSLVPDGSHPLLRQVSEQLLENFAELGHGIDETPADETDVILTTATYGEAMSWRDALLFTARRRFQLSTSPTIYTLVQMAPADFQGQLAHFQQALSRNPPRPEDFSSESLAPQSWRVLLEQGQRGGPILSLMRLIQSLVKCIRVLLVIGVDQVKEAYLFNLVGAFPRIDAGDEKAFYREIVQRIVTSMSTEELAPEKVETPPISRERWEQLSTPDAMCEAARQLDKRHFFTNMIRIADLIHVPALSDSIADQYSEGCFSTWDPQIDALITTATGSARPIDKGQITKDHLVVITGVRDDAKGVLLRQIAGRDNPPPSSEAFEMIDMDNLLPHITLDKSWPEPVRVPVIRSKLHGHRGMAAYDPSKVEYATLDEAYFHYPVSCGTAAQAQGIKAAFARAQALRDPQDPRQVVFALLPGHGVVIVEKWVPNKQPFELIYEYMDAGYLEIDGHVPQGPLTFESKSDGRRYAREAKQHQLCLRIDAD